MTTAVTWQNATGLVTVVVEASVLTHWKNAEAEFRLSFFDTAEAARQYAVNTVARSEAKGNTIPFGPVAFELPDVMVYQIEHANDGADPYSYGHFRSWPLARLVAVALRTTKNWRPPSESLTKINNILATI